MHTAQLDAFVATLTTEQRQAFTTLSESERTALAKTLQRPSKRTPLDMSDAEAVEFVADLVDDAKVTDKSFLGERMCWSKGMANAKGPKGGIYYAGVVSIGFKDARRTGAMKISQRAFDDLRAGGTAQAWVRLKGDDKDRLIGLLANYRVSEKVAR